ncbi:gamma-glutamyltransferase family protein, partial [Burkholderia ubonensis]|uniref:gamma-glutamyltransferase family protein n=1 Tax=Burkholderia ubonensis TaxID=101571 RepID=UPI000A416D5A
QISRRNFIKTSALGLAAAGSTPLASFAQTGAAAPDAPESGAKVVTTHRAEVPMPHAGITAGHPLAAFAGTRMLMLGGSAADAVVAAMAVLNVVEPWASSAAGNGLATCFNGKTGEVVCLAFTGGAPDLLDSNVDPKELDIGPKAVVVPGAFGGWIELARRLGRLPLATLLEPAIGYARDGHPLDASIAEIILKAQSKIARYPTTAAIFLPGGKPVPARALFRNLPLARTFQALADAETAAAKGGADRDRALQAAYDYFYSGPIAHEFDSFMRQSGGWLRMDDMRSFRPRWAEPVSTTYRGLDIYCTPLTSRTGLELCEQLNIVEGYDLASLAADDPALTHVQIEAMKIAKADIYRYAADPRFYDVPVDTLISKDFAAKRRTLILPNRAISFPVGAEIPQAESPIPRLQALDEQGRKGDTTSLSAVDADGNAIAVTTTLGGGFGTFVVMGNTGLLCNNGLRIGSTSPYLGHPNKVAPRHVPLLGNGPCIVLDKGRLRLVFGSPGGETIGTTEFQFLVNIIDRGMPIQTAIEAPRLSLTAVPNFYKPGAAINVDMEDRFAPNLLHSLAFMGHSIKKVGPYSIGSV